jgi:alkanesulfonate monooxygenase SsuD/methylene tetrahydromethanopterin reductase-like flavin-dependent oxidoreductase (luciferase family)
LAWHFIEMTDSKTTNDQRMQVGIDSFATAFTNDATSLVGNASDALRHLVDWIEHAEQVGLDVFGIGEHHRREFLDSLRRSFSLPPLPERTASGSRVPSPY